MSPSSGDCDEFPLVLTSAKVVHYCNGQHRSIPSLRRRATDPEVSLHPETAAKRGMRESDWVEIQTPKAKVRMRAKFDAALHPRVVSAQYGWWQENDHLGLPGFDAFADTGANYNRLIPDDSTDPISGSTGLRSSLCDIRKFNQTST
jgi:anaerobic selenocysteine-containing dehydrogenase